MSSIRHFFRSAPMLPRAIGLIAGILTWWFFTTQTILGCIVMLSLMIFSPGIAKTFFVIGILACQLSYPSLASVPDAITISKQGEISLLRYPAPGRVIVNLKTKHGAYECRGKDLPWLNTGHLKLGDTISVFGVFKKLKITKNPFSYDSAQFHQGNVGTCKIIFTSIPPYRDASLTMMIRSWLHAKVLEQPFSYDVKGLILGMTIGETSELTNEVSVIFKNTGLFHLLVVSGFQLVLIFSILRKILLHSLKLLPASVFARKIISQSTSLLVVSLYCLLCGSSLATERALISLGISSLYSIVERTASIFLITLTALVLTLLIHPGVLFLPSFHLTFAALFGLCVGASLKSQLRGSMPILVATLSTSIVSYLWFGGGSYLAPLYNLVFAPLFSFVTTLFGLFSVILSSFDAGISLSITGYCTEFLWKILKFCSQYELPFSSHGVWGYLLVLCAVIFGALRRYLKERYIQLLWRKRGSRDEKTPCGFYSTGGYI